MANKQAFQREVREFYRLHGRHDLPWRQPEADGQFDPYKILVSEIMLQQTQVGRVIPRFASFLEQFPTVAALAGAAPGSVLRAWNGLGYNRRAKFLYEAARVIVNEHKSFPQDQTGLVALPGVGNNTAGAVLAYAFDKPAVFVETNVRTVFIHHFFSDQTAVSDREIIGLVSETLPATGIRTWYWALMDYGSYLKQSVGNLNRASRSYAKQSPFAGSRRQLRGQVIRLLSARPHTAEELKAVIADERLDGVLDELRRETLVHKSGQSFSL